MQAVTQHDVRAREDYRLLKEFGITTARDAVRWHLIDRGGRYDFSSFLPMLQAARAEGIQVIWDLCHYGWPSDVSLLSAAFVDRFARYSRAVARVIADSGDAVPFYTPINEISFMSFAIGRKWIYPFVSGRDDEIKRQFARALIASIDAVRSVDKRARIVLGDPIVHVIAPHDRPDMAEIAASYREAQFAAWDMASGRLFPELGGGPEYLDIVGVNYYHANQFEFPSQRLRWEDSARDPRMLPFHVLLDEMYHRYRRPLFVGETSHFGAGRAKWIGEVAAEVQHARCQGIPIEGVCLYPVIDRPDWENYRHWHNCGLWDMRHGDDGSLRRVINPEYAAELRRAQQFLPSQVGC
jgi:beta-glucosidase/6-phospho-beta-glucosidase/beta-galactosidase